MSTLRNGQEHGIRIAYDEIARLGLSDNLLLVEESRWVLLQNPVELSLELWPDRAQNRHRESLRPTMLHEA